MPRRSLAFLLFMTFAVPALTAQERMIVARQEPPGTGRIAGTVTAGDSGRPVRFARVTIAAPAVERVALTDDSGSFSFDKLPAAAYSVTVSRPGFLSLVHGQARPGTRTSGRFIKLDDGQQITRLTLLLSQGGSISGVVRDERGEPIYRATVKASRWTMQNGERVLEEVESTHTDERGSYRIGLLASRHYIVSAMPPDDAIPENEKGESPLSFAPAYHPDARSAAGAEAIALRVDEHRAGVDLVMPLVKLSKITGTLIDAEGRPVPDFLVTMEGNSIEMGAHTDDKGRFEFSRVLPGTYTISAGRQHFGAHGAFEAYSVEFSSEGSGGFISGRLMSRKVLDALVIAVEPEEAKLKEIVALGSGSTDVAVTAGVPSDIVVQLDPPRALAGRVVFDGKQPKPPLNGITIALASLNRGAGELSVQVATDGTFTLPAIPPGRYVIEGRSPLDPWTLTGATAGGLDVLETWVDVPRDRDPGELVLTFRDRSTELSGSVIDPSPEPAELRRVIVFPTDERLWVLGAHRIRSAPVSAAGTYSISDLRHGSYQIAVVAGLEPDEWMQTEFLRQLARASIGLTIAEGEKKTQDLRIR